MCAGESPQVRSACISPTPPTWPLTLAGFGLVLAQGEGERGPNLALDSGVLPRAGRKLMFLRLLRRLIPDGG